jgi:hypothetical protein
MAWTKTKTAIITGVVALLLIGPAVTIVELLLPAPVPIVMKEYKSPDNRKPLASGMKRYVSMDGDITVDVPTHWHPLQHEEKNGEIGRFATSEIGLTSIFYKTAYSPWQSLKARRDEQIQNHTNTSMGWRNFTKSETVIGDRKALIIDFNNTTTSARVYFIDEGGYKYEIAFFANTEDGIPEDKLEVYEQVMKSINFLNVN